MLLVLRPIWPARDESSSADKMVTGLLRRPGEISHALIPHPMP